MLPRVLDRLSPEYVFRADARCATNRADGRLMYTVATASTGASRIRNRIPAWVEVRRAEGGIRAWDRTAGRVLSCLDRRIWRAVASAQPRAERAVRRRLHQPGLRCLVPTTDGLKPRRIRGRFHLESVEGDILGDFGVAYGWCGGVGNWTARMRHGHAAHALVVARSETTPMPSSCVRRS